MADEMIVLTHRMVIGEGDTADEAILDWYSKMPAFSERTWWREKPGIVSDTDFNTKKTLYRVFCRFCVIPDGLPMPTEDSAVCYERLPQRAILG
jgi:hypothetical protein